MSIHTPIKNFGLDEELVNIYTSGGCQALAHNLISLGYGELYEIRDHVEGYVHFVVKIGDNYIDAVGIWKEEDLLGFWLEELGDGYELSLVPSIENSWSCDPMFKPIDLTMDPGSMLKYVVDVIKYKLSQ